MDNNSQITPEMARQELLRRGVNLGNNQNRPSSDSAMTPPQQQSSSFGESFNNLTDQLGKAGGGFVQGIANMPIDIINLANKFAQMGNKGQFIPGHDYPQIPRFNNVEEGIPKDIGETLSNFTFPNVSEEASKPVTQLTDALLNKGGKTFDFVRPQKQSESILEKLGSGKTIDQNTKEMAYDIAQKGAEKKELGRQKYASVTEKVGSLPIGNKEEIKIELPKKASQYQGADLESLVQGFHEDPTFQNAHDLQSALRTRSDELRNQKGILKKDAGKELNKTRKELLGKMNDFLKDNNKDAYDDYKDATNYWRDEVSPYTSHKVFSNLVNGLAEKGVGEKTIDYANLPNVFKGKESRGINKVVDDLGDRFKNQMLYHEVGNLNNKKSPSLLADALKKAFSQEGISRYVTKDNRKDLKKLTNTLYASNLMKKLGIGGGIAGALFEGNSLLNRPNQNDIGLE